MHYQPSDRVWKIRTLKDELARENAWTRRYSQMLLRWIPYALNTYRQWNERPDCGYFFENSTRYSAETARTASVLAAIARFGAFDEKEAGFTRKELKSKAIHGLRYLAYTHDSGPADCLRVEIEFRKDIPGKWGGENDKFFEATQTAFTVSAISLAAWLLWEDMDTETKLLVQNVLSWYACRWSGENPRDGTYVDTQLEENSWTSRGIGSAAYLFPEHPLADEWSNGFRRWAINSLTVPNDRLASNSTDPAFPPSSGIPIKTSTMHPDFTSENHGFVHPTYMILGITQRSAHMLFALASGEKPDACTLFNNEKLYHKTIRSLIQTDGMAIPVQGQDWWYNRQHEILLTHSVMNVIHHDPVAARWEWEVLNTLEKLQLSHNNGCFLEQDGERFFINRFQVIRSFEQWAAEDIMYGYLLHLFGGEGAEPIDLDKAAVQGVRVYPFGGMAIHHSENAISCFSWRNRVMAVTYPEHGIWAVTPHGNSGLGMIGGKGEKVFETVAHHVEAKTDGFTASVLVKRGLEEKLLQHVAFLSLPDGRSVYMEQFEAAANCSPEQIRSGVVGVRNENYSKLGEKSKGFRTIYLPEDHKTYNGSHGGLPDEIHRFGPQPFVNLDNQIGYLLFHSQGVSYDSLRHPKKWKGVEDRLVLNDGNIPAMSPGERTSPFIFIALPNRNAEETAREAKNCTLWDTALSAVVLETGGYLIQAHFENNPSTVTSRKNSTAAQELLYEGRFELTSTSTTSMAGLDPLRPRYCKAVGQIQFDGGRPPGLKLLVIACGDYTLFANNGSFEIKFHWSRLGENHNQKVELAPGRFVQFEK